MNVDFFIVLYYFKLFLWKIGKFRCFLKLGGFKGIYVDFFISCFSDFVISNYLGKIVWVFVKVFGIKE